MAVEFDRTSLLLEKNRCINEKKRARNAAQIMGISELLYVLLGDLVRIKFIAKRDFKALLNAISGLYAMVLTRNDTVVLEHSGILNLEEYESGLIGWRADEWQTEFELSCWDYAIWIEGEARPTIQFYDAAGDAIHKIFAVKETDVSAFTRIIEPFLQDPYDWAREAGVGATFLNADRDTGIEHWFFTKLKNQITGQEGTTNCQMIDKEALLLDWRLLAHRNNIGPLFKQYKISRPRGYALLSEGVFQLEYALLQHLFTSVKEQQLGVKITVTNAGALQTHRGGLNKMVTVGPWFNVLDPKFNMHLMESEIATVWLLTKGFDDDYLAHIECFDQHERLVLSLAPCQPHSNETKSGIDWWAIVNNLALNARRVA